MRLVDESEDLDIPPLKRRKSEASSRAARSATLLNAFTHVIGESIKNFSVPKVRTMENYEATLGIRPAKPLQAWLLAAIPNSAVPGEPLTPSASSFNEEFLVDVGHILEEDVVGKLGKS